MQRENPRDDFIYSILQFESAPGPAQELCPPRLCGAAHIGLSPISWELLDSWNGHTPPCVEGEKQPDTFSPLAAAEQKRKRAQNETVNPFLRMLGPSCCPS